MKIATTYAYRCFGIVAMIAIACGLWHTHVGSGNARRDTAATVTVYKRSWGVSTWGNPPTPPTAIAVVQQPTGLVRQLTVDVTLSHLNHVAAPVRLVVNGSSLANGTYHATYPVMSRPVTVPPTGKHFRMTVPVPPVSGDYTVMAEDSNHSPVDPIWIEPLFVDHGGFYWNKIVHAHVDHKIHGFNLTVNAIQMTPQYSIINLSILGARDVRLIDVDHIDVTEVLSASTLIQSETFTVHMQSHGQEAADVAWTGGPLQARVNRVRFSMLLRVAYPTIGKLNVRVVVVPLEIMLNLS